MNVLSLFDGMSCGRLALERAGIPVDNYYSSEIDKWAIKVADKNWPQDTANRLGDITKWKEWGIDWSSIDLVLAGSPCQSISNLGKRDGLEGKSGLFFCYYDILCKVLESNSNARFILENVQGNKEAVNTISDMMGVSPTLINSNEFSAQNRKRLYWANIEYDDWEIKNICLQDILEEGIPENSILSPGRKRWLLSDKGQATVKKRYASIDPYKAQCLTMRSDASWNSNYVTRHGEITKLTPIEYERLQTVPDNYTDCVSNTQRYKMLGNGWTVDVIAHILSGYHTQTERTDMKTIAITAKDFLEKHNPYLIGRVDGVDYYEHPTEGDEAPLIAVYKNGDVVLTDEWEIPEPDYI